MQVETDQPHLGLWNAGFTAALERVRPERGR
jgi:hypothetical protein